MTREQMISLIHRKFHGIKPEIDLAKQLLDFVEESGMVPPAFAYTPEPTEEVPTPKTELVHKWEHK